MSDINFRDINEVYFIGIGGVGVSALARMFLERGVKVSGSDLNKSALTSKLENLGVTIFYEQLAGNIPETADLVIYTIAIPKDSPELIRAKELGIRCMTYPEALGLISSAHDTIAISGTHGKTTTTAMTAEALLAAGVDPTVIVGALLKSHQSNFIGGKSENFVVEACEYRESFLELDPKILVITNIEADHLDFYKDLDHVIHSFNKMAKKVPSTGFIITDPSDPNIARALEGVEANVVDYTKILEGIEVGMPGVHNRKNAAAALTVAKVLGVDVEKAKSALKDFSGTWRRFEEKGVSKSGAVIYDDYAHHPTEVRAALAGAREAFPEKKIIAVFQPHLYSRTKELFDDFVNSFADADEVILLPIYGAREEFDTTITHEMLAGAVAEKHESVLAAGSFDEVLLALEKSSSRDTIILTLGAGDVYKLAETAAQ